ncbi:MAG: protein kinase, partial [Novosphingobium sp.]|nr:protein kinase [Novosphingobium sp.]
RRIASGLKKAHDVGVVHRDISPDNILLENDRLDRARVIDFGIVKDTNAGAHTIIDNGFAGKMKFVAPEQLGDFGHSVGNWSDVYSLALVILALAQGEPVDLAGSPVDAITKRRNGIDTSGAPEPLRSVLDRMLVPDPAQRMRSMDEVIAALDQLALPQGGGKGGHKGGPDAGQKPVAKAKAATAGGKIPPRNVLIGSGVAAGVALLAGAGFIAFGGKSAPSQSTTTALPAGKTVALEDVQQAILASLPNVACSWVDVAARVDGGGFSLAGEGVSSQPAQVESQVYDAVRQTGAKMTSSDFSKVAPIDASYCSTLDALRGVRDTGASRLMASQPRYELAKLSDGKYAGQVGAKVVTDISLDGVTEDFALYSIEKSNEVSEIIGSREQFMATLKVSDALIQIAKDKYRVISEGTLKPGWSGLVLITGRGGFSDKLLSDLGSAEGRARFSKVAQANGWKASIAWYKFVDDIPN